MSIKSGTSNASKPTPTNTLLLLFRNRSWHFWVLLALSMFLPALILGTALTLPHALAAAAKAKAVATETVDLGYAKYQGTTTSGINSFLGIRFAAPPTGDLRFKAPQPPLENKDLQHATKLGKHCISTPQYPIPSVASEDCLFLNIYAPEDQNKTHPVFVYIQGGGFNGAGDPDDGTKIVEAGEKDVIVVTFNYRVGLFGFLASKEVKAGGDINAGNLDQRFVLQWVQQHIAKFGGDPKRVTVGGGSAGAASVNLHMIAYGGRDDGLFQAAAGESNSFGQQLTIDESQYQYDALANRTGCTGNDSLACLRKLDVNKLAEKNTVMPTPGGAGGNPLFYFSNVIDGDFTQDYTYKQLAAGKFIKVPSIFGGTSNEGTVFTPGAMNNYNDVNNFLKNQFVKLTASQLAEIDQWYPKAESFPGKGDYWRTAANAYGEMRYNCPGLYLNQVFDTAGRKDTWHYHWDVISPANAANGNGATHVADAAALWGTVGAPDNANTPIIQGYWTSFIRTHDVNKLKSKDAPTWESWDNTSQKRLRFVNDPTKNVMETVDQTQRDRCAAMVKIGPTIAQ